MAIAHDAVSNSGALASDPSWTHTPTGTPRGVVVEVAQFGSTVETVTCTYGGVTMEARPVVNGSGLSEPHVIYPFFLGASIPTGAQTVTVTASGSTANKRAFCYTATAAADTAVDDEDSVTNSSLDDPSVGLTASATSVGYAALCSGLGNANNVTAGSGFTKDFGGALSSSSVTIEHGTSPFSAGGVTFAFVTSTADDVVLHAILLKEQAGSSPQTVTPSGVSSAASVGTPTAVPGNVNVAPSGVASAAAVGTPTALVGNVTVTPAGVASAAEVGVPTAIPGNTVVTPTGVPSAATVGVPVTGSAQFVEVAGVPSAALVGTPTPVAGPVLVQPTSVPSAAQVGVPTVAAGGTVITVPGVESAAQVGQPTVDGGAAPSFHPAIHGGRFYL